jgi:hypothetical protein
LILIHWLGRTRIHNSIFALNGKCLEFGIPVCTAFSYVQFGVSSISFLMVKNIGISIVSLWWKSHKTRWPFAAE